VRTWRAASVTGLTSSDEFDREARFSPNGRYLAFVRGWRDSTALYVSPSMPRCASPALPAA